MHDCHLSFAQYYFHFSPITLLTLLDFVQQRQGVVSGESCDMLIVHSGYGVAQLRQLVEVCGKHAECSNLVGNMPGEEQDTCSTNKRDIACVSLSNTNLL